MSVHPIRTSCIKRTTTTKEYLVPSFGTSSLFAKASITSYMTRLKELCNVFELLEGYAINMVYKLGLNGVS